MCEASADKPGQATSVGIVLEHFTLWLARLQDTPGAAVNRVFQVVYAGTAAALQYSKHI